MYEYADGSSSDLSSAFCDSSFMLSAFIMQTTLFFAIDGVKVKNETTSL